MNEYVCMYVYIVDNSHTNRMEYEFIWHSQENKCGIHQLKQHMGK